MLRSYNAVAIRAALDEEHPCEDNSCDIAKAVECGYFLWAGHIMQSATECPKTDDAMADIRATLGEKFDEMLEEERKLLLQESHVKCGGCGSLVWTETDTVCDDCHAEVNVNQDSD